MASQAEEIVRARRVAIVSAAENAGLLDGNKDNIGGRMPARLVKVAKQRSGLLSTTDLLEYALAKVALEDDFGAKLVARKGLIPEDLDL